MDDQLNVSGASCPRGVEYGKAEVTDPRRTVTALANMAGMRKPLCVKTAAPIPKNKIFDVIKEINHTTVIAPVSIGDVIIEDVAGTGIAVVATTNIK